MAILSFSLCCYTTNIKTLKDCNRGTIQLGHHHVWKVRIYQITWRALDEGLCTPPNRLNLSAPAFP